MRKRYASRAKCSPRTAKGTSHGTVISAGFCQGHGRGRIRRLVRPPTTVAGILDMLFESRPRGPTSTITSNEDFYLTSYRSPQPFAWTSGAWL